MDVQLTFTKTSENWSHVLFDGFFMGYADYKKGYQCYDPHEDKVYVTRDVVFHETVPYFDHAGPLQGEREKKKK